MKEAHFSFAGLDVKALNALVASAKSDPNYKNKGDGRILEDTLPTYDCFKVNCGICVDVCPNRANIKLYDDYFGSAYQIVHIESRCNECDNCHTFCTRGGFPYFKKITIFVNQDEFIHSKNAGILKIGKNKYQLRDETGQEYIYDYSFNKPKEKKKKIERILETMLRDYPYLIENESE
jgi:putative selenate reductase